jgi:hypothetical protein
MGDGVHCRRAALDSVISDSFSDSKAEDRGAGVASL